MLGDRDLNVILTPLPRQKRAKNPRQEPTPEPTPEPAAAPAAPPQEAIIQ